MDGDCFVRWKSDGSRQSHHRLCKGDGHIHVEILLFVNCMYCYIAICSEKRVWKRKQSHDHIAASSLELLVSLAVTLRFHSHDSAEQERVALWEASLDIYLHLILQQQRPLPMTLGAGVSMVWRKSASFACVAERLHAHSTSVGKESWILAQSCSIAGTARLGHEQEGREQTCLKEGELTRVPLQRGQMLERLKCTLRPTTPV